MGKSKYLVYQCSLCPYFSSRKGNLNRHNNSVHQGSAYASIRHLLDANHQFPPSLNSARLTLFDNLRSNPENLGQLTFTPEAREIATRKDDFMDSVIKKFEADVGWIKRLDSLMRPPNSRGNWSFLQSAPSEWPLPNLTGVSNRPPLNLEETINRVRMGFRGFICEKCYSYDLVEFGLRFKGTKPISFYGGIFNHSCSAQPDPADSDKNKGKALYQLNLLLHKTLLDSFGTGLHLHALEITSELSRDEFAEELNPVDMGPANSVDPIYSVIKDGTCTVKFTNELMSDFLDKAMASYCLATFEEDGKRRLLFLIIVPKPTSNQS